MNYLKTQLKQFLRYKDLMKQIVKNDLKLKYRRSILGYLWSVLNPLFTMIVQTIVFSQLFSRNIDNFPLYLISGQVVFNYMNVTTTRCLNCIRENMSIIKKIYVPKYIFVVGRVTSCFVDFILSLVALLLIMIFTGSRFSIMNLLAVIPIIQLYVFCIGLSLFLAQLNVFFKDVQYIYSVIVNAWMYLTPLFYPLDVLPEFLQHLITRFNPMYFYVAQFRACIYSCQFPETVYLVKGGIIAVVMLVIGIYFFRKNQDKFILYV